MTNTTSDPRQQNCPWMMPILYVQDIQRSLDFYKNAFGFSQGAVMADDESDKKLNYAEIIYKDDILFMLVREKSQLMPDAMSPQSSNTAPPMTLYVYCDDINSFAIHAKQNMARIVTQPDDAPWGDRTALIKDPDDFLWCFATKITSSQVQQATA